MTKFEKYFVRVLNWYKDHNVDVMVHGSTLLNIIRTGTPEGELKTDREINLMILAEDMTNDQEWLLRSDNKYFEPVMGNASEKQSCGVFYSENEKQFPTHEHWGIDPGFVFLTKLWKGRTTRFKCHGGNECILIPDKFVSHKAEWTDVNALDISFKAPAKMGAYLDYYYGDWWHRKPDWHWRSSPNLIKYDELVRKGEIC